METTETAAVDSAEEMQQAEPAATAEKQPAGASRTYTADEHDAIVKQRIDKQNAKHATELQAVQARVAELERLLADAQGETAALKAKAERDQMVARVTKATGIDASALAGDTEEELTAAAERVRASLQQRGTVANKGASAPKQQAPTKSDAFAKFMSENFSD